MVTFGFVFGFLLGVPVAIIDHWFGIWWLLPLMGIVVGWTTNKLGMWLIFEPLEPKRILGIKAHGLFLRRQDEAAEVYARNIADEVITLERIGDFLHERPARRPHPADARPALCARRSTTRPGRCARRPGRCRQPATSTGSATPSPSRPSTTPTSRSATRRSAVGRATRSRSSSPQRTKELPPADFVEMMRSAFREDEWMLYAHGGDHGLRGWGPPPDSLRGGWLVSDWNQRTELSRWAETTDALPGIARILAGRRRGRWRGPRAPTSARAGCWPGR